MERKARKGFGGRPRTKEPEVGDKVHLGIRVTPEMKARLEEIAATTGRSQSQEAEFRLARSFDREDLLPEVLTLAYGREAAGLLMMLGLAMVRAGEFTHVDSGAAADGVVSWADNATAFGNVTNAVLALLDAAKPEENYFPRPGIGLLCAEELIKTMRDPTARSWFAAHSRTAATIRSLLGPVVDRMTKAAETRPIVGLEPREQARQALVSDIADVLSALVVSKIRLHETRRADSPVPSREEIFEMLEKRFPIEEQAPAEPATSDQSDPGPQKADARPQRAAPRSSATGEFEPTGKVRITHRKGQKP